MRRYVLFGLLLLFPNRVLGEVEVSLEEALSTAVEHNADLNLARERIRQQTGVFVTARAARFPTVRVETAFQQTDPGRIQEFQGTRFGDDINWNADLVIQEQIWSGGRNTALEKQADADLTAATHQFQGTLLRVLSTIRQQYATVLLRYAQVKVREESVRVLEQELGNEQRRFAAGTVSDFNVLRAEVELSNAQTPLIRARNEARVAEEELRRLLGKSDWTGLRPVGELPLPEETRSLDKLTSLAHRQRPELREREQRVKAAVEAVTAARSGYFPRLSAEGRYGAQKNQFSPDLDEQFNGWVLGLRADWDIFDSFGREGRISQAEAVLQSEKVQARQTSLDIDSEVRRAHSSYTEARQLLRSSERVGERAAESLRRSQRRLEAGVGTQLEVLDAQLALTEARTNEVQARYDSYAAYVRLRAAIGEEDVQVEAHHAQKN